MGRGETGETLTFDVDLRQALEAINHDSCGATPVPGGTSLVKIEGSHHGFAVHDDPGCLLGLVDPVIPYSRSVGHER
ncbi:MAG: hypothetical protein JWM19_7390 [Actinomycetia bacterium]|nr:hypothetical protein [Actinomycetes bacterium]